MRIEIEYANNTQSVDCTTEVGKEEGGVWKPLELQIVGGGKGGRMKALLNYIQHMDYSFRCLKNTPDDYIRKMRMSELWFLPEIHKNEEDILFGSAVEDEDKKYKIVIYDITAGVITEKMYLTTDKKGGSKTFARGGALGIGAEPLKALGELNMDVLKQQVGQVSSPDIMGMIGITEKYLKGYHLKWNPLVQKIYLTNEAGMQITYDGIPEEDVYTVFKLFALLLEKGEHIGVYYINAINYTTPVLEGLLSLIDITYKGKALVILYNCDYIKAGAVDREVVMLPNYYAEGK